MIHNLAIPSVLQKAKQAYTAWIGIAEQIPRIHRYGLRNKVECYFLEFLESVFVAIFSPLTEKTHFIGTATKKLSSVKFFLQLCWENKLIPNNKYARLAEQLDELGRILGGWKKGVEKKTPTHMDERKPQVSGRKTR